MKSIELFSLLRKKKRALLLGFFLFSLLSAFSQTPKVAITGTVVDSAGIGVPTVTVSEKGTKNSTATGATGGFSMNVAGPKSVLVITSVGYAPQEVRIGN